MSSYVYVFLLALSFEYAYGKYVVRASEKKPLSASNWAVLLTITGAVSTWLFIANPWFLLPEILGVWVGTYVAVKYS